MINPLSRQAAFFRRLPHYMNILKTIGASFTKLWRWIRETAWVQPLLIVGAIFAVIFSIPKATSWVQSFGVGTSTAYYMAQKKTLEGASTSAELTSEADLLTGALMKWSNFADQGDGEYATYQEFRTAFEASSEKSVIDRAGGEKFYLVYVAKGSDACDEAQEGFESLQDNWGSRYVAEDGKSFAFSTIYTDEDSTNDDDFALDAEKTAFNRYLLKFDDLGFFADAGARFDTCAYKKNANLTSSSNYDNFIDAGTKLDSSSFIKPTVILVDFSKEAFDLGRVGVSEILFGISGSTAYDKAELLMQMWNHTSKSDTSNPFTTVYNA